MAASSAATPALLQSLFNHIALPPRLPAKQDSDITRIEHALLVRLLDASRAIRGLVNSECYGQLDRIRRSLESCKSVNTGGRINKTALLTELRNLKHEDLLILHVLEQNAGLLIGRRSDGNGDSVTFEAFEASPLSEGVLASTNALQWDFPGCAIAVPFSDFSDDSFQENLAIFLEQASTESVKRFAARTNKAGSFAVESRDTVDPALVTQMLMTLLEVNGHRIYPPLMRKRVRDDVCWTDGAEKPWRRSPFWLVLRVGVQRYLCTLLGAETGRVHYKFLLCLVFARLMDETLDHISLESLAFLRTKLCRRIVKLEVAKEKASPTVRNILEYMFTTTGPIFHRVCKMATARLETAWNSFKLSVRRPIQPLPRRATERDLHLTLPNSGAYLQKILAEPLDPYVVVQYPAANLPPVEYFNTNHFQSFARRYYSLSGREAEIENLHAATLPPDAESIAKALEEYLNTVNGAYETSPEQKSVMLLTIMDLWMLMDTCATQSFPLLEDYNPGFHPDLLDVLYLSNFQDMLRLQKIQLYLQDRHTKCTYPRMTVFHDPCEGCFAEQYFNKSESLQALDQRIRAAAERARTVKELEWQTLSSQHEELNKKVAEASCMFTTSAEWPFEKVHDNRGCTKCYMERQARRIRIAVHEDPLPSNPVHAKATVFELACPKPFAAYRDVTWRILGTLGCLEPVSGMEPRVLLREYSELQAFMEVKTSSLSLASTTKSFLASHYSSLHFPVSLEDLYMPNGLKLGYYDTFTNSWPARQTHKTSFAHHCRVTLPTNSPFSCFQSALDHALDADGPSSYEIVASQSRCPASLTVHEFMAYQVLLSGKTRRWAAILTELGSSNLNFSTEGTTLLISRLALQAGPPYESAPLRTVHRVFGDKSFCQRLMEQVRQRLDGISSNWRETQCMDMLITLILRLGSLTVDPTVKSAAGKLLEKTRTVTSQWVTLLRAEVHSATDADTSRNCSRYAFWAALMCRRTVSLFGREEGNIESEALRCFIVSSIALQENLVSDPAKLPVPSRNALIRDLKTVHRMRSRLRRSLEASPGCLMDAINTVWPHSEGYADRTSTNFEYFPRPNHWWVHCTVDATKQTRKQVVHYHLLEGHLLVDGKPLGQLPVEYRTSVILHELFGNQSLLTYPSALLGMTYVLAVKQAGHQIHLGFRNSKLVVRARLRDTVVELIPREVFLGASDFDLPASLVYDCVHWLDLRSGLLEIRKRPDIWRSKPSNWILNVYSHQAYRRTSFLVDPSSLLCQRVARQFDRFEHPRYLTVFQPSKGSLSVELRRLELSFRVNRKNVLESSELRLEIDTNQDAGTFYGLKSAIVLRDPDNPRQRSLIVPMGSTLHKRMGVHVVIEVINDGDYGRFTINDILGRLDCPAEPRLLYLKAKLHALTSFVLPDPLTERTGTAESLHCLRSGYCQPWAPLRLGPYQNLQSIAKLTPKRVYYPTDMKVMQQVAWDESLTTTIQHDAFRPVIDAICRKSEQLSLFAPQKVELPPLDPAGDPHLFRRSYLRRLLYEPASLECEEQVSSCDLSYSARDGCHDTEGRANVFESVSVIRSWSPKIRTTQDLAGMLQNWPAIGGLQRVFDKTLLSHLLDVDFAVEWGAVVNYCRLSKPQDKYRLMFLFAALSFRTDVDMVLINTLIAFAVLEDLRIITPPKWPAYVQFRQSQVPRADYLVQLMKTCCLPYPGDERGTVSGLSSKLRRQLEAAELEHERKTEVDCKALAQFLLRQWPCSAPTVEGFPRSIFVDVAKAMDVICPEWERLFQNMELSCYIQLVQDVLRSHHCEESFRAPRIVKETQEVHPTRCRGGDIPSLSGDLLRKVGPVFLEDLPVAVNGYKKPVTTNALTTLPNGNVPQHGGQKRTLSSVSPEVERLQGIVEGLVKSQSSVRQQYGQALMQSLVALKSAQSTSKQQTVGIDLAKLSAEISQVRQKTKALFDRLCEALERNDSRAQWLKIGGLWPLITPVTLLEQLRSTSTSVFGTRMKESIVVYALSITTLQRLLRIESAYKQKNSQRLMEEQSNTGHSNWQPLKTPDWLLLEIDANILIRPDQVEVALATISPSSRSNSVLQMNMGLGKTSCVMPMVASVIADKKRLLRVIVPKALLLQTAQLLQTRLGGLLGRELRHVPFSRKTSTKSATVQDFYNIHSEILKSFGVMVSLPEHILSFKLSGLQRLSDGRLAEASQMVKVDRWMSRVCRDVLDESDVTLAVRTHLIYPSGSQKVVDGHPHRWQTAEQLLGLVEGHLAYLRRNFPLSIEVVQRATGAFPFIFFLRRDVEEALMTQLVNDIYSGRKSIVPTAGCSKANRLDIKKFISEAQVEQGVIERVQQIFPDKPAATGTLYLLRGLLVHRILLLALKKRWNVQYGLHPKRDPIAVPFHAKGVPSDQAEWGHPDVAIMFTSLAFYYDGIRVAQLRLSLEHLLKSDDPATEYDRWTYSCADLPDALREWNAINVDDESQLVAIWQHVRYNIVVIDYFLNKFVFPKHAKQFEMKLQASGWDIPLLSPSDPLAKTTGFSGTNDNRAMLPLTVKQEDLPGLLHTNAEVLTYLLQPRNRQYVLAADDRGKRFSELGLLTKLKSMGIRVLIDAGAQILEMDNLSLVKAWISVDWEASAGVFFDAENKAMVVYRHGHQVPLLASPFADNLVDCVVYLDEAHTRGTDLKLPVHARGALTLALGQTKDHTVQAAMRLRQLATSQSVVFFAPPEVHHSILDFRKKNAGDPVDSFDVLFWLLEQTCSGIEQLQPLYYSQGVDFCRRTQAASDNPDFLVDDDQRRAYLHAVRQAEQQTLEQLYKPKTQVKSMKTVIPTSSGISVYMKELDHRRKGFQDTGTAVHGSALQEVEQEREVAYEVEAVREVQKPAYFSPLSFPGLHRDIIRFVETGRLVAGSAGYEQAFVTLRPTALGRKYGISNEATASKLYVSVEFTRTISFEYGRPNDNFQRPVNWILWSPPIQTAIVVIPEEAELIISLIHDNPAPLTHLLTYAAPVTRKMLHFNNLDYYAIPALPIGWKAPAWLKIELGILAGRLYFEYEEYEDLRKYIGFQQGAEEVTASADDPAGTPVEDEAGEGADGAINGADKRTQFTQVQGFTAKPLTFLQEWLTVRRKGQDFSHTPMGSVCQGKELTEAHPFFTRAANGGVAKPGAPGTKTKFTNEETVETYSSDEEFPFDDEAGSDDGLDGEEIEASYVGFEEPGED